MTERPRKNHFGAKIAERMAREQNPAPPDETPDRDSGRSIGDFHRELEQRIRNKEAWE